MSSPNQSFRCAHPFLFTFIVLGVLALIFTAGISSLAVYLTSNSQQADIFGNKSGIGVIDLKGVIVSADETLADIAAFRENTEVKAIVVRIDSPGGTVGASQEIYQELLKTRETKPVVASMGSIAASGGYYAAIGAQEIFASPGTLTGSIGVILKFANLEKIFDKIGYEPEVIKSGAHKDIGSTSRPMTDEERALLQDLIDNVYQQFITAVSKERSIALKRVHTLADGRIFSGEQAKNLGLIDDFGNFNDAVMRAASLAGLSTGQMPPLVYPESEKFSLLKMVADGKVESAIRALFERSPAVVYQWSLSQ